MTMPGSSRDREQQKFEETTKGDTAVRVILNDSGLVFGKDFDEVDDTTTGLVQTILLKLLTATVRTITITYTDSKQTQYNLKVS
jgi:hypothetical protein